jgi:hypothetical protein
MQEPTKKISDAAAANEKKIWSGSRHENRTTHLLVHRTVQAALEAEGFE